MSKKKAISLVVIAEAVIYLFLLVGVPLLDKILFCPSCNSRELFAPLLIPAYFIPGLIGIVAIVIILRQKKEVKGG